MNREPMKHKEDGGFTLIESLIAVAIFAVGLAALMPLAVSNVRGTNNAAVRTEAVAMAQRGIEQFRARLFDDIPAPPASGALLLPPPATPSNPNPAPALLPTPYSGTFSVEEAPGTQQVTGTETDIRRIRVVVSWNMPDTSGSVTLMTSKTRY